MFVLVKKLRFHAIAALVVSAFFTVQATADTNQGFNPTPADYKKAIRFHGAGVAREPDTTRGEPADANWCFDAEMQDAVTHKRIGTGVDCLNVVGGDGVGLQVVGTTFFYFDDKRGNLVSQGLTSVQPVTHGSAGFSHITGAIPQDGDNNVLSGSRIYRNASGPVRLSGAVDMSAFQGNLGETIFFSCLFILDLKQNGRASETNSPVPE